MYKTQRNYENLNKALFDGVGEYGIPVIQPSDFRADNWIGFNYAKGCEEPEIHGVHFFLDDYQFVRVWSQPDSYLNMLRKFQAVLTPDFSTYTDFPKAIQVYNHYRKHWLGAYWQMNGINVIPTISWSDAKSFEWCFDGEPIGGTVAVSSVGTQANRDSKAFFRIGFERMVRTLKPSSVIMYGATPPDIEYDNIIPVESFQTKWRNKPSQNNLTV